MLRSLVKTSFACAYTWTGAAARRYRQRGQLNPPFVACYHRVVENFDRSRTRTIPSMLISTKMLERHIDWLSKRFTFASLDEIGRQYEGGRREHKPLAAITFDDGYSDVYHHAYPMLRRKGIPAAVFVVTGLVGTGKPQIFDRLYLLLRLLYIHGLPLEATVVSALESIGADASMLRRLRQPEDEPFEVMTALLETLPQHEIESTLAALERHVTFRRELLDEVAPLTWDMIETMHRAGITIGSHTKSHRLLTSESFEVTQSELIDSKRVLEEKLKATVTHFAYPDGRFNPVVVKAVKSAGYRYAFGICQAHDPDLPFLTIPRKVLWERSCLNVLGRFSPVVMNCQVHGIFDEPTCREHDHGIKRAIQAIYEPIPSI